MVACATHIVTVNGAATAICRGGCGAEWLRTGKGRLHMEGLVAGAVLQTSFRNVVTCMHGGLHVNVRACLGNVLFMSYTCLG